MDGIRPAFFDASPLYRDEEQTIALVTLNGSGKKVRNRSSDTTYEVISGIGLFIIDGEPQVVYKQDSITVPRGAIYKDCGDLVMLATCRPPFDEKTVEVLE